jgi:hypothetical protein
VDIHSSLYLEPFNYATANQIDVDDFIDIALVNIGVPRALRINDQDWALFATIKATGFVNANFALAIHVELFDTTFGVLLRGLRTIFGTALTTIIAVIQTEEHVFLKVEIVRHEIFSFKRVLPR